MTIRKLRLRLLRLVFVPYVVAPLVSGWRWPEGSPADFASQWLGYALLLAGLGLRMWATLYIGQRKSAQLVTDGPYSASRNPLYTGTFAIVIGAALTFESPTMLLIALLAIIPLHVWVVLAEERHMERLFGESFARYKRQTPRFLFSFRNYRSPETLTVSTFAIRRAFLDTVVVLLLPPLAELIELAHAHGLLPKL